MIDVIVRGDDMEKMANLLQVIKETMDMTGVISKCSRTFVKQEITDVMPDEVFLTLETTK